MDMIKPYFIDGWLPSVSEPLSKVSDRLKTLLGLVGAADPMLRTWFYSKSVKEQARLVPDASLLETIIYQQSCINGDVPRLDFGYCLGASTLAAEQGWSPRRLNLMMKAGGSNANRVWFQTDWNVVPDPHLIGYAITKKILFALADSYEPVVGGAYPGALDREQLAPKKTHPILAGWMVLLPAPLAGRVIPPPAAITQTRPDGGLFMAATDETFDAANPDHMAVSKAMQDAIEPINDWSLFKPIAP